MSKWRLACKFVTLGPARRCLLNLEATNVGWTNGASTSFVPLSRMCGRHRIVDKSACVRVKRERGVHDAVERGAATDVVAMGTRLTAI